MNAEHTDPGARFAAPAERDLPPGRHDLHREILMNHMLTQRQGREADRYGARRPRRVRGRLLAAVASGTVIAAGVVGYAVSAGNAPAVPRATAAASHPAASSASTRSATRQAVLAAAVLRAAAAHLARTAPAMEPGPGQWIFYKTVDYNRPGGITTDEEWITFDGSQTAYHQNGQIVTHTSNPNPPGPSENPWDAWNATATPKTAYDVLASLPTDPQALLAVIARHAGHDAGSIAAGSPVAGVTPKTEAQREFDYLTRILWNAAIGTGGPPAAEAAAYQALATLPGITVQQGITDTAGGQAIGVSDDGGYDQLLIDPVSYQVIGLRQLSTGIPPKTLAQILASGHLPPSLRKLLAGMTKAERTRFIADAKKQHQPAAPPRGTVIQEIVYAQNTEVPAPGDR